MEQNCIGQIAEIFEGDEPHRPVGCPAQAWSVAEVLRLAVAASRCNVMHYAGRGRPRPLLKLFAEEQGDGGSGVPRMMNRSASRLLRALQLSGATIVFLALGFVAWELGADAIRGMPAYSADSWSG